MGRVSVHRLAHPGLAGRLDLDPTLLLLPINQTFLSPTLLVNAQLGAEACLQHC